MAVKVLHYLRHLGLGGTEKTCQLFFEHANKQEFEVAIAYEATGTHPRLHEFAKGALACGGHMFEIDSYGSGKKADPTHLQHVIDSFHADILHVYRSGYAEFPSPGLHVSVPHFVETNVFGFYDANMFIDRSLFMSKWLMDYTTRRLPPLIARSAIKRFDFVNNPVESPCTDQKLFIREQWGNNAIILGRVGRPDNGIYNAVHVEAARLLRLQGYDVRFLVVAPPSNMIKDLAEAEIPFYAIEPTVDPLVLSTAYNTMDIYAHARADGETFGVNIAEAMMHGLPVVTHFATPSFEGMGVFQSQTELVDDGINGLVVQNNAADYSEALKRLIDDRNTRECFGHNALEKAAREYHVDACMKKLEIIYREIVNE